ncbi:hypothetical protein EAI_09077 [Harpegnathos saltator]|uniref:Uncharacterized protein n=1 Tax=Harpegnathos saltator TaxID=610380 RepID=E2C6J2_HARSA|nr:hypothetical protein EAI_09077 [Harpegnathos saltator]
MSYTVPDDSEIGWVEGIRNVAKAVQNQEGDESRADPGKRQGAARESGGRRGAMLVWENGEEPRRNQKGGEEPC